MTTEYEKNKEEIKQAVTGGKLPSQTPSRGPLVTDHRIMCLYHANCADGFGAAWAMHHCWPKAEIEFIPMKYGEKPPETKNRVVYVLDFSFARDTVARMLEECATFMLIDHHKTALENLIGLDCGPERFHTKYSGQQTWLSDGGRIHLDMNHSGAGLAWDFFSKGSPRPPLIDHIEDRDLWRFRLRNTREIQASLFSYPYDMNVWDTLMVTSTGALAAEGVAIERKHFKDINELVRETKRFMVIGGHTVPVANIPYTMSSDACRTLMALSPEAPFSACYIDTPRGRVFSLRSEGFDVSSLAKGYGGGGHQKAAGFTMPIGWEGEYTHLEDCMCETCHNSRAMKNDPAEVR